ncbi:MAG: MFS transporter [Ferrimicrobium sp.]
MSSAREVFRNVVVRRLVVARALSSLGTGMLPVALSFTILHRFHSATDFGLVLGSESVSTVAVLFFAGVLGDRLPRKRLVMTSDIAIGVMRLGMAILALSVLGGLWFYLVAELIVGVARAIFFPAFEGWFQATIPGEMRQQANALRSVYWNLGNILGPAIAGVIAVVFAPAWALALSGMLPLASVAIFIGLPVDSSHNVRVRQSVLYDIQEGWQAFRSRTWIWSVDVQFALWHVAVFAPLVVLGPVIATTSYHGATGWAIIWGSFAVGGVIGGIAAFRSRTARPLRMGLLAMLAMVALLGALSLRLPLVYVVCGSVIAGVGSEYFGALFGSLMQTHVPPAVMAKVTSFDFLASSALLPFGYALAVPLSHLIGIDGVLDVGAIYVVASTIVVLIVPSVWSLGRYPIEEDR